MTADTGRSVAKSFTGGSLGHEQGQDAPQEVRPAQRPAQRRNGAGPREADFQRAVIDLATRLGLKAFHSTDSRRDTSAGFPDLVIAGRRGVIFAELKTAKGRVEPAQREWIDRLRTAGQIAVVWRPEHLTKRPSQIHEALRRIR